MSGAVTYNLEASVATVTMDDGKVNALSFEMLEEISQALEHARSDRAVVVLTGRPGVFSAGFDLAVLRGGGRDAVPMLRRGFLLAEQMLSFPTPIVVACTGHAVAMGTFLLLSADLRIGALGPYRITANEVAIGLTLPHAAVEICRERLSPTHRTRAMLLAEVFSPEQALEAGFLDRVVPADELDVSASDTARQLAALHLGAHEQSKQRDRSSFLAALQVAMELDEADLAALGT